MSVILGQPGWVALLRVRRQREHVRIGTALPVYLLAERPGGPWVLLGGSLLTVSGDADGVEASLRAGLLACPSCTCSLSSWGFARARSVRTGDRLVRLS